MIKELGPCPLCGGEGDPRPNNDVCCPRCGILCDFEVWNELSALAAQNRRREEALKWCREWFRTWNHAPGDPEMLSPEALEKLCEEALK